MSYTGPDHQSYQLGFDNGMVEMRARLRQRVLPALRSAKGALEGLHGKIAVDSKMATAHDINVEATVQMLKNAIQEVEHRAERT